jgi:hypothetical protein
MLVRPLELDLFLGLGLFALGVVPGPLATLRDALQELREIRDIADLYRWSSTPRTPNDGERLPGQSWLAIIGVIVMALSVLGLLYL